MTYLQLHTLKGKWGVSYIDTVNWDNTCDLLSPEYSIEEMIVCVEENLEGMTVSMGLDDAFRVVIHAAETYGQTVYNLSIPRIKVYTEAARVVQKELDARIESYK